MPERGLTKRQVGSGYELQTALRLADKGYRILAMNYRCRIGEIDIIARKDRTVVFVEVKYRGSRADGYPEDAVDAKKQTRIRRVAEWFMAENPWTYSCDARFDVAACGDGQFRYYENAFGGM